MPASGKIGNKGGGRKSQEEELEYLKDKLKEGVLEELAASKVFNSIRMTKSKDRQGIKDIALPVYLKSKIDRLEVTLPKPLLSGESNKEEKIDGNSSNTSNKETSKTQEED